VYSPDDETEEAMLAWLSDKDAARYRKTIRLVNKPPMRKALQQLLLWLFMWPLSWLNELGRTNKDKK